MPYVEKLSGSARSVEISLNALIDRQNRQLADLLDRQIQGQTIQGLDGLISQAEAHLDRLNERLEQRLHELERERHCTIADTATRAGLHQSAERREGVWRMMTPSSR